MTERMNWPLVRGVPMKEITTASVDARRLLRARDGPSISLGEGGKKKEISRLSVRNGNGILFPRTVDSFRQLADRYLAD